MDLRLERMGARAGRTARRRRDSGWRPVLVRLDPAGEQQDPQLGLHLLAVGRHGRPRRCRRRHRGDGAELRVVLADLAGDSAPDAGRHRRRQHGELRGGDAQRRQLAGVRRLLHQRLPADRRESGPNSGRHRKPWRRLAALVLCERRQHQRRAGAAVAGHRRRRQLHRRNRGAGHYLRWRERRRRAGRRMAAGRPLYLHHPGPPVSGGQRGDPDRQPGHRIHLADSAGRRDRPDLQPAHRPCPGHPVRCRHARDPQRADQRPHPGLDPDPGPPGRRPPAAGHLVADADQRAGREQQRRGRRQGADDRGPAGRAVAGRRQHHPDTRQPGHHDR